VLRRLGDVINSTSVSEINLLKIDVEGAEKFVLKGIEASQFKKIKQMVIEVSLFLSFFSSRLIAPLSFTACLLFVDWFQVHDIEKNIQEITELLKSHGYETFLDQEDWFVFGSFSFPLLLLLFK
jgi:hypothetical protein